jgi:hypothetical protein
MKLNSRTNDKESYRKALEINYDFMWKSLVQTVDLLTKGTAYYFTIIGVVGGFLFTSKIHEDLQLIFISVITVISFFFAIIMLSFGYGVLKGIHQMENALKQIDAKAFHVLEMSRFFRRGRVVGIMAALLCLAILLTLSVGLAMKMFF